MMKKNVSHVVGIKFKEAKHSENLTAEGLLNIKQEKRQRFHAEGLLRHYFVMYTHESNFIWCILCIKSYL